MEHSAGMVLFRKRWFGRQYLILQYTTADKYWGLAKGHVEKGETEEQAALREVQEETSLVKVEIIPGFKEKTRYFLKRKKVYKEVVWFLGKVEDKTKVKISQEHDNWDWVSFNEAMKKMTFEKDREVVRKGEGLLKKK